MRTRGELEIEARRLEQRVRERRESPTEINAAVPAGGATSPASRFTFPESSVTINAMSESERPITHRMLRYIDAIEGRAGLEYRLVEEEFVSGSQGELVRHYDPIDLMSSNDALEALSAGFQRLDEDRLWERIEPVARRIEANGFTESEHAGAVAEVERLTSDLDLSATARMRMKVDVIDLLEGRLEMGDFVSRAVARQECFAMTQRVAASRQITESIEV